MSSTDDRPRALKAEPENAAEPAPTSAPPRPGVDILLEVLLGATMLAHLLIAPYTKVEESFNMQAIHDVSELGVPWPFENVEESFGFYDHTEFPGVVPRSFTGAAFLGSVGSFIPGMIEDGVIQQILARAMLGGINVFMMMLLGRRASNTYSAGTGRWYLLLQASQFHVMYYASRTLPNMFAFGIVTYAIAELLPPPKSTEKRKEWFDRSPIGLQLLIVSAIIFRCEIGLLFITTLVALYLTGWITIYPDLVVLAPLAIGFSLAIAVPIDTYFWQTWPKPLWAEFEGFWFNTIQGKSSEWGTSPYHYYFVNSIPKLIMNPFAVVVLIPLGAKLAGKQTINRLVLPALSFVAIYSLLPHKEWRFIVYVIPTLTLLAAIGADHINVNRAKSPIYRAANLTLYTTVALSFVASFSMSWISSLNYPGGTALTTLQHIARNRTDLNIHMDVKTCMTGATRFTQNAIAYPTWKYSKEEDKNKLISPLFWQDFDYEITANPSLLVQFFPGWEVKAVIPGYAGVGFWKPGVDAEGHIFIGGRWLAQNLVKLVPGSRWPIVKMVDSIWIVGKKEPDHLEHLEDEGFEDIDLDGKLPKGKKPKILRDEL